MDWMILLLISANLLFLCVGYYMGRNSANMPVSVQPRKEKKYVAEVDPYAKAMYPEMYPEKKDEIRIGTVPEGEL